MSIRLGVAAVACCLSLSAAAAAPEHGLDRADLDESVSPCRNFYQYAVGGWLKNNPLPADHAAWDSFREIEQRTDERLKGVLEALAEPRKERSHEEQLLGDLYWAALNEKAIDKAGLAPIRADLAEIDAMKSSDDVVRVIRSHHRRGDFLLFRLAVDADLKDADAPLATAVAAGLSLPDRDDYTRMDHAAQKLREQFRDHVAEQLRRSGLAEADVHHLADAVLALETGLAEASLTRGERRDPAAEYHPMSLAEANSVTPHFDWFDYAGSQGAGRLQRLSLSQPKYFAALERALADVPIETWRAYLRWQVLHGMAPFLSRAIADADYDFFERTVHGQREMKPRWQRAVGWINASLGQPLGHAYAAKFLPPEARDRARALVDDLLAAARARLGKVDWLGAATREQALAKLARIGVKVGYPDQWRDWSTLTLKREQGLVEQLQAIGRFEQAYQIERLGRPIDRAEWRTLPQTPNAYYRAAGNEIVLPAAILQSPFFDVGNDPALNFGAIGAIAGHELTHAFDDRGSQFDAAGNLASWWADSDRNEFAKRTQRLVEQFNALEVLPGLKVNGKLTLGENLADLGGIQIAYDALRLDRERRAAAAAAKPAPEGADAGAENDDGDNEGRSRMFIVEQIDGYTEEQRFFLGWARIWRRTIADAEVRARAGSDPHAPGPLRVNAPLSNIGSFSGAFRCKIGDAMARTKEQRVAVW